MQNVTFQFISFFLSFEFTETILATFVDRVFAMFIDRLLVTLIISLHTMTESSTALSKYLLFSQIDVLGFQR